LDNDYDYDYDSDCDSDCDSPPTRGFGGQAATAIK
jgi:hypothetical protein